MFYGERILRLTQPSVRHEFSEGKLSEEINQRLFISGRRKIE